MRRSRYFLVQDTACLDGLHRLGNALRRQGEGKAHVAFAQRAKAGTRRAQHTALFHKVKTEVHALCVLCRDGCPHEHAAVTVRHIPANGTQAAAQSVAALLVQAALRFYHVQRAGQGGDGRFLHRQEHAEIDLTAQLFKGGYHVPPAHKKADAGTGDVEAFGQAEELHAHIHGTRRIEEAVAHGPVKDNVAVGVVVDDENVILFAVSNLAYVR